MKKTLAAAVMGLLFVSCGEAVRIDGLSQTEAPVFPDYKGVTVPPNISPLNFNCLGEGKTAAIVEAGERKVCIRAKRGLVTFPRSLWKNLLSSGDSLRITVAKEEKGQWIAYRPFSIHVADDRIDPYVSYRLIPPGYQAWNIMGIYQRNLETFSQTAVFENRLAEGNCVNCHSYQMGDPSSMLFHSRAVFPGTIMVRDGAVEKLNTKTDSTISALVYPSWHPSGKFVAFSVNTTNQNFFNHDPNRVEVYDSASDVVVYDVENHRILYSPLTKSTSSFETFPTFSPDGKSLYFCSAEAVSPMPENYANVHYGLFRTEFDPETLTFGDRVDTLFFRKDRSVSFPRVSPDGKFLAFTLHGFGNFSIWHRDADLWMYDLRTGAATALDEANSSDVESYHSWSQSSRWLVFSSRRLEIDGKGEPVAGRIGAEVETGANADSVQTYPNDSGLYTRLYICHIDSTGKASKPFLLPQKNPLKYYQSLMLSYNIPEQMTDKVRISRRKFASVLRKSEGVDVQVGEPESGL